MPGRGYYNQIAAKHPSAVDIKLAAHQAIFAGQRYPWIPNLAPVGRDSHDHPRDSRAGKHFARQKSAATPAITLVSSSRDVDLIGEAADIGEFCSCSVSSNQFEVVRLTAGIVDRGYKLIRGLVIIDSYFTMKAAADLNRCGR